MLDNLQMVKKMEKENYVLNQQKINIQDNLKMINLMEKEYIIMLMVLYMKVHLMMVK